MFSERKNEMTKALLEDQDFKDHAITIKPVDKIAMLNSCIKRINESLDILTEVRYLEVKSDSTSTCKRKVNVFCIKYLSIPMTASISFGFGGFFSTALPCRSTSATNPRESDIICYTAAVAYYLAGVIFSWRVT